MTALILSLAIAQQQTITFTHPCANSAVVLGALGKKLGVTMKPGGSVTKDYFLVSFHDVTQQEALDKIASTLNAKWETKSGVTYLTRTHQQELDEQEELKQKEVKRIQAWLDKNKVTEKLTPENTRNLVEQALQLAPPITEYDPVKMDQMVALEKSSPVTRYAHRLAQEIGAQAIADAYRGDPIVYAQNPKGDQRQFPSGPAREAFEKETAILKQVIEQTNAVDRMPARSEYSSFLSPFGVQRWVTGDELRLTVRDLGGFYYIQLDVPGYMATYLYTVPKEHQPKPPAELAGLTTPYEPSDFERALVAPLTTLFAGGGVFTPVGEAEAGILNDPSNNEPLTLLGSKWLLDSAQATPRNLIAVLDEEAAVVSLFASALKRSSLGGIWATLLRMSARYEVRIESDWITVLPDDPVEVRDNHIDRFAWRNALRSVTPGQIPDLDSLASFAALSDDQSTAMMAVLPAALQYGLNFYYQFLNASLDLFRIYGRLEPRHRAAAKNGGAEVAVSALPTRLIRNILEIVAQENARVSPNQPDREWGWPNVDTFQEGDKAGRDVVVQGVPRGTLLRVRVVRQEVIYRQPSEGERAEPGETADQIGAQIASADVYPEIHNATLRPFFAIAPAEQLYIEVEFPGVGFFSRRIQVDGLRSNVVFRTLQELPDEVRAEIEKSAAKYREMYKKLKGGGG